MPKWLSFLVDLLFSTLAGEEAEKRLGEVGGPSITGAREIGSTGYDRMAEEERERQMVVDLAMTQVGKPYEFGIEVDLDDEDPEAFDCSELFQWAFHQSNKEDMPDGSMAQYLFCRPILSDPLPGDLCFLWDNERGRTDHVEMSIGNGETVGAVGGRVHHVRVTTERWMENHERFAGWRRPPFWSLPLDERLNGHSDVDPLHPLNLNTIDGDEGE